MTDKFVAFYSNCIPVKGYSRSIICDLQNENYYEIPNNFYTIAEYIVNSGGVKVSDLLLLFPEDSDGLLAYIEYFIGKNLLHVSSKPRKNFLPLKLDYEYPSIISNLIIDFDATSDYSFGNLAAEIVSLLCRNIQIRFFCTVEIDTLVSKIAFFSEITIVENIEIILPNISSEQVHLVIDTFPKLNIIILYNSEKNAFVEYAGCKIQYLVIKNISTSDCGAVRKQDFLVNTILFAEAQKFNTCLNRKISIDTQGKIRNCPSMHKDFGTVDKVNLEKLLSNRDFKKVWKISKDKIIGCKDCEFRYICVDCRANIVAGNDLYSKPSKCRYDPYVGKWF